MQGLLCHRRIVQTSFNVVYSKFICQSCLTTENKLIMSPWKKLFIILWRVQSVQTVSLISDSAFELLMWVNCSGVYFFCSPIWSASRHQRWIQARIHHKFTVVSSVIWHLWFCYGHLPNVPLVWFKQGKGVKDKTDDSVQGFLEAQ